MYENVILLAGGDCPTLHLMSELALHRGTVALAPGFIPTAPDSRFFPFKYSGVMEVNPSNICSQCDIDEQQK